MHSLAPQRRARRVTLLAVGAISATALVLSGCSADNGSTSSDGTVTLTVIRSADNVPTDAQMEAYTEYTDGRVQFDLTEVPFGQFADKVSVLSTSANPPDIYGYDMPNTANYASEGVLLPLDEYLPDGWKDDVLPATLKEVTYDDQIYSMGVIQDALVLYYNKTLTDAAGIEVPTTLEDGWTWAEAHEAMMQCQEGTPENPDIYGLAPTQLGSGTPGPVYSDLLYLRSAGDPDAPKDSSAYKTFYALSPDGDEVDGWLNTPEAIEAAEFYQSLFNGDTAVTSKTGRPNAFADGIACFDIFQSLGISAVEGVDFEWGVAPLPYIKSPIVHTGAVTLGVSSKSKNADEAAEFVVWASTGDGAKNHSIAESRLPNLTSVYDEIPEFHEPPRALFFEELTQWGQPRPPTVAFSQYSQIVETALKNIAYGSDPEEQLNSAVAQLTPMLQ
ncbi:ABC transporter substrate-binding protein [Microbacterium sp. NPDC087589]|uniref:ABC transporter substrate-binding protein n=1 Tax=Microbacterium sp. NPDC087589 TaxID=3364191 RepID=UPI00381C6436